MTVAKRRHNPAQWFGILALVLTAGCATIGGPGKLTADSAPEVKQAAVAARAQARWEELIKGDLGVAYAYLSPASRATLPLDVYKTKHKVGMYREIKVNSVDCQAAACTVKLTLRYDFKRYKGVETLLTEHWLIEDGQAWFVEGT